MVDFIMAILFYIAFQANGLVNHRGTYSGEFYCCAFVIQTKINKFVKEFHTTYLLTSI